MIWSLRKEGDRSLGTKQTQFRGCLPSTALTLLNEVRLFVYIPISIKVDWNPCFLKSEYGNKSEAKMLWRYIQKLFFKDLFGGSSMYLVDSEEVSIDNKLLIYQNRCLLDISKEWKKVYETN